jgi:hypothetical protein
MVMGCKWRDISSGTVNSTRSSGQQRDVLSENSKKEYLKSVTELLKLEEKRFLQGICYFTNNIPVFI